MYIYIDNNIDEVYFVRKIQENSEVYFNEYEPEIYKLFPALFADYEVIT